MAAILVLIPFKAGQWFKLSLHHCNMVVVLVLIPFKAGQWFKPNLKNKQLDNELRLNPF